MTDSDDETGKIITEDTSNDSEPTPKKSKTEETDKENNVLKTETIDEDGTIWEVFDTEKGNDREW